jgi:hypothetical protein
MNISAFVDHGFPSGIEFTEKFLFSQEFKIETLKTLAKSKSKDRNKLYELIRQG